VEETENHYIEEKQNASNSCKTFLTLIFLHFI